MSCGTTIRGWLSVGQAGDSLDCNLVSLYVLLCEYGKEAVTSGLIAVLEQHKFIVLLGLLGLPSRDFA